MWKQFGHLHRDSVTPVLPVPRCSNHRRGDGHLWRQQWGKTKGALVRDAFRERGSCVRCAVWQCDSLSPSLLRRYLLPARFSGDPAGSGRLHRRLSAAPVSPKCLAAGVTCSDGGSGLWSFVLFSLPPLKKKVQGLHVVMFLSFDSRKQVLFMYDTSYHLRDSFHCRLYLYISFIFIFI